MSQPLHPTTVPRRSSGWARAILMILPLGFVQYMQLSFGLLLFLLPGFYFWLQWQDSRRFPGRCPPSVIVLRASVMLQGGIWLFERGLGLPGDGLGRMCASMFGGLLLIGAGSPLFHLFSNVEETVHPWFSGWLNAGWDPFWDSIPWPFNNDSPLVRKTGIPEPKYTRPIPKDLWKCPRCGVQTQQGADNCYKCGADLPTVLCQCQFCGAQVAYGDQQCWHCGQFLRNVWEEVQQLAKEVPKPRSCGVPPKRPPDEPRGPYAPVQPRK